MRLLRRSSAPSEPAQDRAEVIDPADAAGASRTAQLVHEILAALLAALAATLIVDVLVDLDGGAAIALRVVMVVAVGTMAFHTVGKRPLRSAMRQQATTVHNTERRLRQEAERHQFTRDLQDALDMADGEDAAMGVLGRAVDALTPRPTHLLLSATSQGHLRSIPLNEEAHERRSGCSVATPGSCPAIRRGQTLVFESSRALSACPHLGDIDDSPCSAVCIPVTVLGNPTGIVQSISGEHDAWEPEDVDSLETVAMHAGTRIGTIRAFATSERQAATDELTGLLNRRSLESAIDTLTSEGLVFSVIFADLDHFKDVNDAHGHETGDRALRLFAEVLRHTSRAEDHIGRYGGEEFLIIMRDLNAEAAISAADRIAEELRVRLGRSTLPSFTSSFGIAHSSMGRSAEEIIALADLAMFEAKTAGRNRARIAGAEIDLTSDRSSRPVTPELERPQPPR
ncbi:MAG: sensor domain-containing diguanylate cyclase [Actinomycetota bacterium]